MSIYRRGTNGIYWVRFQWRRQEIRRSAKTTVRRVAEKFERDLREDFARIDRGGKPRRTFGELMVRFGEDRLPSLKESSAQRYRVSAKPLLAHFRDLYLDEINKAKLAEFIRRRRRDGVTSATIRRDLACLSSAFSHAVHADWLDQNIVKAIDKRELKEAQPRVRWARQVEYKKILATVNSPRQRSIIIILAETGMRLGELLNLQRADMDLGRKEVHLTETKTGAPRVVPLSREAAAQLTAQPQRLRCPYVFFTSSGKPPTVNGISTALRRVFKRAEIKDFRPHDLRHTFATWYLQRGGRLERLQQILGHRRIEQTMKYAHVATQDLHDDMQRVGTNVGSWGTDSEQSNNGEEDLSS